MEPGSNKLLAAGSQELHGLPSPSCPRCQGPLVDPQGLGWCQKCGYCRSLDEAKANPVTAKPPAPAQKFAEGAGAVVSLAAGLPNWFWLLLLGMALFAAASLLPGLALAPQSFARALWCTLQMAIGLLLVLSAQFWAVMYLAPEDEKIGTKDVFLPFRLWGLVFQRLPAMRWHVWIAGWGLSILLSALLFVGGLSHWLTYLPGQKPAPNAAKAT